MWFLISEIIFQFICLLYLLMHLLIFSSFFIKTKFLKSLERYMFINNQIYL